MSEHGIYSRLRVSIDRSIERSIEPMDVDIDRAVDRSIEPMGRSTTTHGLT